MGREEMESTIEKLRLRIYRMIVEGNKDLTSQDVLKETRKLEGYLNIYQRSLASDAKKDE